MTGDAAVNEPRLWVEHGYIDLEDVDDFDLAQMARVSPPGWSEDRPDTAMLHLGPQDSGISLLATVAQLRRLLDSALSALTNAADDQQAAP
jgi:hypothetical protein